MTDFALWGSRVPFHFQWSQNGSPITGGTGTLKIEGYFRHLAFGSTTTAKVQSLFAKEWFYFDTFYGAAGITIGDGSVYGPGIYVPTVGTNNSGTINLSPFLAHDPTGTGGTSGFVPHFYLTKNFTYTATLTSHSVDPIVGTIQMSHGGIRAQWAAPRVVGEGDTFRVLFRWQAESGFDFGKVNTPNSIYGAANPNSEFWKAPATIRYRVTRQHSTNGLEFLNGSDAWTTTNSYRTAAINRTHGWWEATIPVASGGSTVDGGLLRVAASLTEGNLWSPTPGPSGFFYTDDTNMRETSTGSTAQTAAPYPETLFGVRVVKSVPGSAAAAALVWDEARSSHVTPGTFGEGHKLQLDHVTGRAIIDTTIDPAGWVERRFERAAGGPPDTVEVERYELYAQDGTRITNAAPPSGTSRFIAERRRV